MVNYFTLEEAARILGTTPAELRKMADRNEIRAFRDRGNLRFRTQDIQERARQLGRGSDPDLRTGDAARPKAGDSPVPRKSDPNIDFELSTDEGDVDLGSLARSDTPSSGRRSGHKSSKLGPVSPATKTGSDSDVRLVADGSDVDFRISSDSDIKMHKEPPPPAKKPPPRRNPQEDSGVRIVPLDSDSDVKVTPDEGDESSVSLGSMGPSAASDSDIRLHQEPSTSHRKHRSKVDPPVTEEIDLDAEMGKAAPKPRGKSQLKPGQPGQPALPTSSPFELSDPDLASTKPASGKKLPDSSDDFDLTPMSARDQSPVEMDSDEEVTLGELTGRGSGINLQDPADSGISLEQAGSGGDIEVTLDAGKTPPPSAKQPVDSSDEFELSLDGGDSPGPTKAKAAPSVDDSDNEFDLSLEGEGGSSPQAAGKDQSDSEFELTLDAEGGLAPLEDEESSTEERDIFETDFEVPALDEESGSQAVALDETDTDLESSDFDLAIGEEDIEAEDSGSQVTAIEEDEEEVRPRRRRRVLEEEEPRAEEEEAEERPGRAVAAAAPAPWGVLPAIVMFPCVIVMFLAGLMAFELVHGMWGYHSTNKVSGLIVRPMAETFTGQDLPK